MNNYSFYFRLSIFLFVILGFGCSKVSESEAEIRKEFSSIPADMPIRELGVVEFESGTAKEFEMKKGKSLSITATELNDGNIEMKFEYGATSGKAAGLVKESYSETRRFLIRPGTRCAPKMGDDVAVVIRPVIAEGS